MNRLLVLEDSSRVGFGGGQKMTLVVCGILKNAYKISFVDFTTNSRFTNIVSNEYGDNSIICVGRDPKHRNSSWCVLIFNMLFHFKSDINNISRNIELGNTILYITNKRSLLYGYILHKMYNVNFIYHAHLVENPNKFYYLFFRKMVKNATSILCVSKTVLKSINLKQCHLLYNPSLNNGGYKGEKNDTHFVAAFIGSLIPIKGVEYFIDAAKLCPNVEFRIYGEGDLWDDLECRAQGKVHFMGFKSDIISDYYHSIDIVVIPTVIQEALSLVALDAKSVGLPLIVTAPGGQAEIVEDCVNGFHVPMKNPSIIANKINLLSNNLETYNMMSKASFDSSKLFSFYSYKEKILSIFSSCSIN